MNSPIVNEQIFALQVFADKLRKAYHGDEVEIVDDSEDNFEGSGSGSGDSPLEEDTEENKETVTDEENVVRVVEISKEEPPSTSKRPEVTRTVTGGAAQMGLSRALAQYLIPIVLVWFGGAITDLL